MAGEMVALLPNAADCMISQGKLHDYLLNLDHPDGGAKAKFLESFGFSRNNSDVLRRALSGHAMEPVAEQRETTFGSIYEVVAPLPSPDGRNPVVRSVWMVDVGATLPRLITLVPAQGDAR